MRGKSDDQQILVENEEAPATLDNAFANNNGLNNNNNDAADIEEERDYGIIFAPATLASMNEAQNDFRDTVVISEAPPDRFYLTYIVFSLLGVATMAPWNFFVTAEDYWMWKFRNTTYNVSQAPGMDLTPMQKSFTCDLTLTASISGTVFLILHAIYGQKVPLKLKMIGTMSIILLLFLVTTAFVEVNTDNWQELFFLLTLFSVILLNICSATMCGALFGFAGLFPSSYMSSVVSGQALGGIFTAFTLVGVLGFGTDPKTTAFIYFTIGSATVLLSIILYIVMTRRGFFQYYMEGGDKYSITCNTPTNSRYTDIGVALEPDIRTIFSKIYVHSTGISLVFATSLAVYPAVTVLMQSQDYGSGNAWSDIYYMPVTNYVLFNCFDYFGRVLAGICNSPRDNAHTVLLMSFLRLLYIPLLMCSNTDLHHFLPTLVQTDAAFMLLIATFALTNGYLGNILLMMAPRAVLQHEREMASAIMAASLSAGLVLGSVLSMVFVQLL